MPSNAARDARRAAARLEQRRADVSGFGAYLRAARCTGSACHVFLPSGRGLGGHRGWMAVPGLAPNTREEAPRPTGGFHRKGVHGLLWGGGAYKGSGGGGPGAVVAGG